MGRSSTSAMLAPHIRAAVAAILLCFSRAAARSGAALPTHAAAFVGRCPQSRSLALALAPARGPGRRCGGITPSAGITSGITGTPPGTGTALFMGTNRKSRRQQKQAQTRSRDQKFYDAIQDADEEEESAKAANATETKGMKKGKKGKKGGLKKKQKQQQQQKAAAASASVDALKDTDHEHYHEEAKEIEVAKEGETPLASAASVADAPVEAQPELSTVIVDEDTGFERIAQGKAVMDVVTRKAVKLSDLGPEYRMAQFSPGVPPEIREKYRFENWDTITVPDMISALRKACEIPTKDEETGETVMKLPPHPSVSNDAIDFVLANRDYLSVPMKKTLGRVKLRAQSLGDLEGAQSNRELWKHFATLENHVSAPFRQMVLDAETRIGPNFGNLDIQSFCSGERYERAASYVVLKGMVAHWEKKYNDATYVENTPQTKDNFMSVLATGDPRRYLPNPPVIFRLDECTKICAMAQKMTAEFVADDALYADLPEELRFVEEALRISGGTELRKFVVEDFCPREGVTPEALREGVWRLYAQLSNMQIDPYGDITNTVGRLAEAMSVGTDRERDPYADYLYNLDRDGPGYFQTYTFNEDKNSLVRFLDSSRRLGGGDGVAVGGMDDIFGQIGNDFKDMMGGAGGGGATTEADAEKAEEDKYYKVPDKRAMGRPHNLGWLDSLDEDDGGAGEDGDKDTYESDNWREVK